MLILIILIIFLFLIINEFYGRKKHQINELDRKIIHLGVGSFVAFWPFLIDYNQIRLLSLAFLVTILLSKKFNIFQSIHAVERPTIGEIFFAVSVGLITYLTKNNFVYMAAILQMSLADGLAAVFGVEFGFKNRYKIFGQFKSIVGTFTFLVVSTLILLVVNYYGNLNLSIVYLMTLALCLASIENLGVFGLDNLIIPIMTVLFFK